MTFENKKEFYLKMDELNNNKPWSLIGHMERLSERFLDNAKRITPMKTASFKKKLIGLSKWLLVVIIITLLLFLTEMETNSILLFGGVIMGASIIFFLALGIWAPNYENETYYQRQKIAQAILVDLESQYASVTKKIIEVKQQSQTIKEVIDVNIIKEIIKGGRTAHAIDYMGDENILKYWNEIEKDRRIDEKDKDINDFLLVSNQLEKEMEFCKNIQ